MKYISEIILKLLGSIVLCSFALLFVWTIMKLWGYISTPVPVVILVAFNAGVWAGVLMILIALWEN